MMYSGEHKEPLVSVMEITIFKGKEKPIIVNFTTPTEFFFSCSLTHSNSL